MRAALVIPTLNAERRGLWTQVLDAVSAQILSLEKKIVIDSESDDAACSIAEAYGWECWKIRRKDFNHGLTRDWAVRELAKNGIDTIIFLSQDVILATPEALTELTDFLWRNPIAGCYGKQRSLQEHTLDAWQRLRCYPDQSRIKTLNDVPQSGLMTCFFSNAFSAWKTADVIRCGGFPETDFGEDMLLAAKVLNQNGAIGYCAEAAAFHNHPNTRSVLFARGMLVGSFHRRHPELLRQFGRRKLPSAAPSRYAIWLPLGIKVMGYICGRMGRGGVPWGLFLLTWLLLLPAIVWYDFPQRDVASRYAPMAEAFARGDWQYAFHPRVTPLLSVGAGIISWLTACNGYAACQLASSLLLSVGIFPLYGGCKKIYGAKTAIAVGILYAVCPPFLRLGYYGLRETGSILGIVLLVFAAAVLHEKHNKVQGYWWFAVGEAILLLSRGEVALFALIAFLMLFIWDIFRNCVPWRSILGGIAISVMLSPQLFYNYRMIGYPVPEVRHAVVMREICHKIPVLKCLKNQHPVMPLDIGEVCDE